MDSVLVAGAGAVGSGVGGMLAAAGVRVTFLGRDPHMTAIRTHGLHMEGIWRERCVEGIHAITSAKEILSPPDLVIVTVKSFDTRTVVESLLPFISAKTLVLNLQNGIGNAETIAGIIGWPRTLSGMVIIGFELPAAGRVRVTVQADSIRIGRIDGTVDEPVRAVVNLFSTAGIPCTWTDKVAAHLWAKVLYNAALNPLGAIHGVTYGELAAPATWRVIEQIILEAFQCFAAAGIRVFWDTPGQYLVHLRENQLPATAQHRSSMLQDIERGKRTEIDYINGAIVRLAREYNIPAPANERLVSLIKGLERRSRELL